MFCSGKVYYELVECAIRRRPDRSRSSGSSSSIRSRKNPAASPGPLSQGGGMDLGTGRIAEHGRLDVHGTAVAGTGMRRRVRRPRRQCQPGDRLDEGPSAASKASWSRRRSASRRLHMVRASTQWQRAGEVFRRSDQVTAPLSRATRHCMAVDIKVPSSANRSPRDDRALVQEEWHRSSSATSRCSSWRPKRRRPKWPLRPQAG